MIWQHLPYRALWFQPSQEGRWERTRQRGSRCSKNPRWGGRKSYPFVDLWYRDNFISKRLSISMHGLVQLPSFPLWAQQLAGFLPLSALVEFTDVDIKLHIFELAGSVSLWNWPITPSGVRLLLSQQDVLASCCLDCSDRSPVLHCIDGRYGDWYLSNTPTTTRLYTSLPKADVVVWNKSPNMTDSGNRRQLLKFLYFSQRNPSSSSSYGPSVTAFRVLLHRVFFSFFRTLSIKYQLVSIIGWTAWTGLSFISFMAGCYIAGVYLLIMPVTGLIIYYTHGGRPRRLLEDRKSSFDRLVVTTSSLNGSDWVAFFGRSHTVNSLLNKPLYRSRCTPVSQTLRTLTQLLILCQWTLAVASCAMQDWNAFMISAWILLCAIISAYAYSAEESARDWLTENCSVEVYQIHAEFSSRRAMLTALLYLNLDSCEGWTSWINPILADLIEQKSWEAAVLATMKTESSYNELPRSAYWWKYVEEGLRMGREIEKSLKRLHPSSRMGPFSQNKMTGKTPKSPPAKNPAGNQTESSKVIEENALQERFNIHQYSTA